MVVLAIGPLYRLLAQAPPALGGRRTRAESLALGAAKIMQAIALVAIDLNGALDDFINGAPVSLNERDSIGGATGVSRERKPVVRGTNIDRAASPSPVFFWLPVGEHCRRADMFTRGRSSAAPGVL
jgi:hypothetical protein